MERFEMCKECDWESYKLSIEEALDLIEELPERAFDFRVSIQEKLEDIIEWVEGAKHITEGQAEAVDNMIHGLERWLE